MRKVIVNSTPLIILSNIGHLQILKSLYQQIFIPSAVFKEVTAKTDSACQQIFQNFDWIQVLECKNFDRKIYPPKLHSGEIEVLVLAQDLNADLIVLDDNAAKKTAKFLGLTVTGTLGILLKAKREGFIDSTQSAINLMLEKGFYLSDSVIKLALSATNEIGAV